MAHESEEHPAQSQSKTEIRILPLATGQGVLTDLLRDGTRRMLAPAVDAEVAAWIDAHDHHKDAAGHRQVVRNGHLPERAIRAGLAEIGVRQPRVHDRRPRPSGRSSPPPSSPPT